MGSTVALTALVLTGMQVNTALHVVWTLLLLLVQGLTAPVTDQDGLLMSDDVR
jgi:hypothetical protein